MNIRFIDNMKRKYADYKAMSASEKRNYWKEWLISYSLYIFLIIAIIGIAIYKPSFIAPRSLINMLSLTAANLPIALGIAGTIVLTGTDLSAGRVVGLTACMSAALLQAADYPSKMFPGIPQSPSRNHDRGYAGHRNDRRRRDRPGQRLLGREVRPASVYRHPGDPVNHLRRPAPVHQYERQQRRADLRPVRAVQAVRQRFGCQDRQGIMIPIPNFVWYALVLTVVMWFIWNKTRFRQEHVRLRLQSGSGQRIRRQRG